MLVTCSCSLVVVGDTPEHPGLLDGQHYMYMCKPYLAKQAGLMG